MGKEKDKRRLLSPPSFSMVHKGGHKVLTVLLRSSTELSACHSVRLLEALGSAVVSQRTETCGAAESEQPEFLQ